MLHEAVGDVMLSFGFALLLGSQVLAPTAPATLNGCRYIEHWKGTNIPIAPATPATNIAHAVSLARNGDVVGWVVARQDGKIWYIDGPIHAISPPAKADSVRALEILGLQRFAGKSVGQGQMIPVPADPPLSALINGGLEVYTCF